MSLLLLLLLLLLAPCIALLLLHTRPLMCYLTDRHTRAESFESRSRYVLLLGLAAAATLAAISVSMDYKQHCQQNYAARIGALPSIL